MRGQFFLMLSSFNEEELRLSPRLHSHASGVVLGITQIINGLENPVNDQFWQYQLALICIFLVFKISFSKNGWEPNVRLLSEIVIWLSSRKIHDFQ